VPTLKRGRSDLEIQRDLLEELNWDPRFAPAEVGIEVDDGVVTLRGTVSSYAKLRAAEELAARVAGVLAVHDHLEVLTAPEEDVELARRAALALSLDADVPEGALTCTVRDGVLTIRGIVDHDYQRRAAERAVSRLSGVRRLTMDVEVRGHARDDAKILGDLRSALQRRVPWVNLVGFSVRGGAVTLSGWVRTLADRSAVEETAWRTRGVRHVVDRVVVMGI
jgi:osmotically-inducible protein OsmY